MRTLLVVALLLAPALAGAPLAAAAYPDAAKAPRYFASECYQKYDRRFVHDFTGVLTGQWGGEIEGAACELYAKTGAHFVLALVDSTEGEILENYALHLFERWGIGERDRNDGILLLYVDNYTIGGEGPAVRIEVGYGLEGTIGPIEARDAIDAMVDAKHRAEAGGETRQEATSYALATGTLLILQTLDDNYADGRFPAPRSPTLFSRAASVPWYVWVFAFFLILSIVSALSSSARGGGRGGRGGGGGGWGYYPGSPHWSSGAGAVFRGGGSWGGGGFGGGGGGGFGGGRSGGGGGSGRF